MICTHLPRNITWPKLSCHCLFRMFLDHTLQKPFRPIFASLTSCWLLSALLCFSLFGKGDGFYSIQPTGLLVPRNLELSLNVCVCVCSVSQLCPILCDPVNCSPPGSSVHGTFRARTPERIAICFSRESSWSRDQELASLALACRFFTTTATRSFLQFARQ